MSAENKATLEFGGDSPATWRGRQSVADGSPAIIFRSFTLNVLYSNQIPELVILQRIKMLYILIVARNRQDEIHGFIVHV